MSEESAGMAQNHVGVETKVIYYFEEDTPYLMKLNVSPDDVTLVDFKTKLLDQHSQKLKGTYKYFFKSVVQDFGVVKEEIVDDDAKLPSSNGRVLCWVQPADGSTHSDSASQCTDTVLHSTPIAGMPHRIVGQNFPGMFQIAAEKFDQSVCSSTEAESTISGLPKFPRANSKIDHRYRSPFLHNRGMSRTRRGVPRMMMRGGDASSAMTSDLDTESFVDSDDDGQSRISTSTDITSVSRQRPAYIQRKRKPRRRPPRGTGGNMTRASSFSSITETSMSLSIINVTLNMDACSFLGISIVGQSTQGGDGGISVGSIMPGGAVMLDGRVDVGDIILQVNDVSLENLSNDEAVQILRDAVKQKGPLRLVVAKCYEPNPTSYFTIPRQPEPIRPIDPAAWVAHTNMHCMQQQQQQHQQSHARMSQQQTPVPIQLTTLGQEYPIGRPSSRSTNSGGSFASSLPESDRYNVAVEPMIDLDCTIHDIQTVVRTMARPESGLPVQDRNWLKITLPNAFIGSDLVDWLQRNVEGLRDRREARNYAKRMLKENHIRHTVNKDSFSEQCYYVFADLTGSMAALNIQSVGGSVEDTQSTSGGSDRDTVGPLPPPNSWVPSSYITGSYNPMPPPQQQPLLSNKMAFAPPPVGVAASSGSLASAQPGGMGGPPTARSELNSSESGGSGSGSSAASRRRNHHLRHPVSGLVMPHHHSHGPSSQFGTSSGAIPIPPPPYPSVAPSGIPTPDASTVPSGASTPRPLQCTPPDVSQSRQSFKYAMGNPCEIFENII